MELVCDLDFFHLYLQIVCSFLYFSTLLRLQSLLTLKANLTWFYSEDFRFQSQDSVIWSLALQCDLSASCISSLSFNFFMGK